MATTSTMVMLLYNLFFNRIKDQFICEQTSECSRRSHQNQSLKIVYNEIWQREKRNKFFVRCQISITDLTSPTGAQTSATSCQPTDPLTVIFPPDIFFIVNTFQNSQLHAISLITVVRKTWRVLHHPCKERRLPLSGWDGRQPIRLGIVDSEGIRRNMIYEVAGFLDFWKCNNRTSIFDSSLIPARIHSLQLFSALVAII